MIELSLADARRIALSAQGFGARRPATPRLPHVRAVARRLHALQIDTVNALTRAHYLPAYSRLGRYPVAALDRLTNETHELVETRVGHQASFVPTELTPLLRWRWEEPSQAWRRAWRHTLDPAYVADVERQVVSNGPISLADLEDPRRRTKPKPHELTIRRRDGQPYAESSLAWGRPSDGKTVLDGLVAEGRLTLAGRRGAERLYDLTERVLPASVLEAPTPPAADARRELVRLASSALGVATAADLANYFGLKTTEVRVALRELVDGGAVAEARVEGWKAPAFLATGVKAPKPVRARALLGPFDSLTWSRDRTQRLFGFAFSFEIYVPEPKRRYGYYVLPLLLAEALVARVDLKADRPNKLLVVQAAHGEPGHEPATVVPALADELRQLADWLTLDGVEVKERGDLAKPLRRVLHLEPFGPRARQGVW
jgi:uncharacterized protein